MIRNNFHYSFRNINIVNLYSTAHKYLVCRIKEQLEKELMIEISDKIGIENQISRRFELVNWKQ